MISKVISFLKGKNNDVKMYLNNIIMLEASNNMLYEEAAKIRNQIFSLEEFIKKQKKLTQNFENQDIFNISYKESYGVAFVMRIRNGLLVGKETFNLKINNIFDLPNEIDKFLIQYYHLTMDIPKEIIVPCNLQNKQSIKNWLLERFNKKVSIIYPKIGSKKITSNLCEK